MLRSFLLLSLPGCLLAAEDGADKADQHTAPDTTPATDIDADDDGYTAAVDCNDDDASINPGPDTAEICDGVDNDCDGSIDVSAADAITYYADYDGDGYGDPDMTDTACYPPADSADSGDDCDDNAATVYPGAEEEPYDGIDQDCADGDLTDVDSDGYNGGEGGADCDDNDEGAHPTAADTWYDGVDSDCAGDSDYDADTDGHDSTEHGGDDCNDNNEDINPSEIDEWYDGIDTDCNGGSDYDYDGDGQDSNAESNLGSYGDDCNDEDPSIYLGAPEAWYDGIDQDCDGGANEYDADGDSYDSSDHAGEDCDDTSSTINPGIAETIYDGVDNDCDEGTLDDDLDEDGYSHLSAADCDDEDGSIHPAASETCNDGIDSDCDGEAWGCEMYLWSFDATLSAIKLGDYAGEDIANAGDVNGDTYTDLLIGAYGDDTNADWGGAAFLVLGTASGIPSINLSDADATFRGDTASEEIGGAVAGLGSVDGDIYDDLLIGTEQGDQVYLFFGPVSGEVDVNEADLIFSGESSGGRYGISVAGAGDVDGGGAGDILIGAMYYETSGAIYLNYSESSLVSRAGGDVKLTAVSPGDYLGNAVDGAGDVDGDGLTDLVVGAYNADSGGSGSGAAWLVMGSEIGPGTATDIASVGTEWAGETSIDRAGEAVAGAGDVNGDGYDDVLIGASEYDGGTGVQSGAVYLLYGSTSVPTTGSFSLSSADARISGEVHGEEVGGAGAIDGAGDVDGDGRGDILIATATEDGAVYLVLGAPPSTLLLADADAQLILSGSNTIEAVVGGLYLNADTSPDIVMGVNRSVNNAANQVSILHGVGL